MARISQIFLILLGVAYLINFWVLHDQVLALIGSDGLLQLAPALPQILSHLGWKAYWQFPTLFWFDSSNFALQAGTWIGLLLSLLLIFRIWPKIVLILLWALFLGYSTAGRTFYSFQWDNLMLEATLLALFLPSKKGVSPHLLTIFLMRWLAFRLNFESGMAKLWGGEAGGWLDLSAMQYYYETAPIPTWLGWWVHQMPVWFHQVESLLTLVVEIGVALLIFCGRRARIAAFIIFFPLQILIGLTANYGIFNLMTMAALLFLIEDKDLLRAKQFIFSLFGRESEMMESSQQKPQQHLNILVKGVGIFLVALSILNFTSFLSPAFANKVDLLNLRSTTAPFRSVNVYHLFAHMTRERIVAEIQGTEDGLIWKPYIFRYYPNDPKQKPRFVAPYHPRLDFRLWFLTLSQRSPDWVYFTNLMRQACHEPEKASRYFLKNPFPKNPPKALRIVFYQVNMSDISTLMKNGTYWTRVERNRSQIFHCQDL